MKYWQLPNKCGTFHIMEVIIRRHWERKELCLTAVHYAIVNLWIKNYSRAQSIDLLSIGPELLNVPWVFVGA